MKVNILSNLKKRSLARESPRAKERIKEKINPSKIVYIAYLFSFMGFMADQTSTRFGITNPNIIEINPTTLHLMDAGLWLYVDIIAVLFTILISQFIIKHWNFKYRDLIALMPSTYGVLKLVTGILNFHLLSTLM